MGWARETQRVGYALVGAGAWAVDALADTAGSVARAWQQRDQWAQRTREVYVELAEHGQRLLHRAEHQARRVPGVASAEGETAGLVADADELPISDYAERTAADIAERLPQLSQRELHMVEGYETRHKARATILRRIDELRGDEPWPGYDEMSVDEILPRMREASPQEQAAVADYEQRHKQRRSITTHAPS